VIASQLTQVCDLPLRFCGRAVIIVLCFTDITNMLRVTVAWRMLTDVCKAFSVMGSILVRFAYRSP